jgi:hypothetical protein
MPWICLSIPMPFTISANRWACSVCWRARSSRPSRHAFCCSSMAASWALTMRLVSCVAHCSVVSVFVGFGGGGLTVFFGFPFCWIQTHSCPFQK